MLSQDQFNRYAELGYNRIPLVREVLADLETPLSTYLKLAARPYSYLLESVHGGEKWGRYSIIGLPCRARLEVRGERFRMIDGEHEREFACDDPLAEIRKFQRRHRVPEIAGMPRFSGGLVGFFGYGTVRYIEPRLGANATTDSNPDPVGAPDILLMASDEVVVFDNLSGRLSVIVHADPSAPDAWARGARRLDELLDDLSRPLASPDAAIDNATDDATDATDDDESSFHSSFPRDAFEAAVERCREYIRDGDAYQIVLSQRLSLPFEAAPLDLYRALRTLNPSPYMYYLDLGAFHIAGASPEILVRLEDGEVTVRPIAGTRKRGVGAEQDDALAAELLADPKELAEHLMLVDLGRNDVGRVARIGTVAVTERMTIEKYSHVMHIVSNVTGELRDGLDAIDVLTAAFPAGTLSGAPKVRALEIIEELEPDRRGVYSGAIGYIGWNGNLDTAIAIRTALIKDGAVHIQVGAGIVADSNPAREWEETMSKGRAVFRAVAMARAGLRRPLDCDDDGERRER
ncbi:MAG: anthranilate synthase component I [bacterium]